jgi:glycosyltransferase involved in cell wall biosynthesis
MDVVVIPVFNRPEFLKCTLDLIQKADLADTFMYLFSLDFGYNPECKKVINDFPFKKVIIERHNNTHGIAKQSYNVLSAYRDGCMFSNNKVFLIEDDFFCNPDVFKWHLMVHEKEPNCFCSIATENNNTHFDTENNDEAYYHGLDTDYQSWCVCWNKRVLVDLILKHANYQYFNNPIKYLKQAFHQSWLSDNFCEQDGLIRRIRFQHKDMPVIFPHKPRAFHAGFYSYHRNTEKKLTGTLEDRCSQIMSIVSNEETYKEFCQNHDYYNDSKAIDLEYKFMNDKLTHIQCQQK